MLSRFEELALIGRCIAMDDRNAFGRLVEDNEERLRRFLYNLTGGDVMLCEDLAQEAFIKAYLSIRQYRAMSRFGTWLTGIAVNEYRDSVRRRKELLIEDESQIPEISAPDRHSSLDMTMDMSRAVQSLGENERTVTLLFYMEDYSIKEIAKMLSMPEGTVKSHLSRAKSKLKTFYENEK